MVDRDVGAKLKLELARLAPLNPFEILRVPVDASPEQIRSAYLVATKLYHPNRYALGSPDTIEAANEVFLLIRRAYAQLSDDRLRQAARQKALGNVPSPPRIKAGFEAAPPPISTTTAPLAAAPAPAPPTIRAPGTQPPGSKTPPTQPPAFVARAPGTQPPRTNLTPPPVAPVASARAPATEPPRPSPHGSGTPRPRPPVVPAQDVLSPQTGRSAAQVNAILESTKTRPQRFDQAVRYLNKNRGLEAREILEQLKAEDPHNRKFKVKYLHANAIVLRDDGKIEDAVKELERAFKMDPEDIDVAHALSKTKEQRGKGLFSKLLGR